MPLVSPGLAFLGRGFVYFSVYLGSSFYATSRIASDIGYDLPEWTIVTGVILAAPILSRVYVVFRDFKRSRRAASLGARTVPKAVGKWPGNLDILRDSLRNSEIGYPGDGLDVAIDAQGPVFNMNLLYSDLIMTTCPEHIKIVLASDFHNYEKGSSFHHSMNSVLGTGVFNSDGEMWKFHRSITRPMFTRDRIADFDLFDRHACEVLSKLKARLREGHAVDIQDVMLRFTMDSATEFLFGSCVNSLSSTLPYPPRSQAYIPPQPYTEAAHPADVFAKAFWDCQIVVSNRERASWAWPLAEIWKDKTAAPMKIVNAYIEPIIKEAVVRRQNTPAKEKKQSEDDSENSQTLLDSLLDSTTDLKVLRDELLNIMIAGRDTTAATLTFAMYALSQHPDVARRLRAEVLEHVGPARRPDFEDLKEMKYLRAFLNETLRLFPVVPFDVRQSIGEATWPSPDPTKKPLYLPPHTKIIYSVFMMHRRKDLWGADAEEFDPDRFLDERLKKYLLKNSFIFLPFNAGPRICLGQQYAYNEMSFMMIRFMQNFTDITLDLDSAPPESTPPAAWAKSEGRKAKEKMWPKSHVTMYANGGVWVKMKEAESA